MRFHFLNPDDLSLSKAASAQGPILGDSGPLQWSKKAKTECPNPNSYSTILQRLPFCPPEVALKPQKSVDRTCHSNGGCGGIAAATIRKTEVVGVWVKMKNRDHPVAVSL